MKAILSDIHGNMVALQAVLRDMANFPVEAMFCLGDTLGVSGDSPFACLDRVMGMEMALVSYDDQIVLFDPEDFSYPGERHWCWLRERFAAEPLDVRIRRTEFLKHGSRKYEDGDFLFVHGSARNPVREYVFPEDILNLRKMNRIAENFRRCCFAGHTHIPGVFLEFEPGKWQFRSPAELDGIYRLDERKVICNVGSAGQPKDGDWRACYVLFDGHEIHFRRVEYDVEEAIRYLGLEP